MRLASNTSAASPVKRLVILGSTGSIGESALRVVEKFPDRLRVVGLAADRRVERLLEQALRFGVRRIAVGDPAAARRCAGLAPPEVRVLAGPAGLADLAADAEADLALAAIVGLAGLEPVLAALERGIDVALASKEALVVAGPNVLAACARTGARLLPVDSEHSAVFQCLEGRPAGQARRIILTASGGPFFNTPQVDFDKVTVAEVLKHPRWKMGRKVTVDSATMMNKGLERMEARWLFGLDLEHIDVLVHPESVVHSLVEFADGGLLAQLSASDMRFAIQYALLYPDRAEGGLPALDLAALGALHFAPADERRFPCLALAREAGRAGGTMPAVLNAANEIAVQEFLGGRLAFSGIGRLVERVMGRHAPAADPGLDAILEADRWARRAAADMKGSL